MRKFDNTQRNVVQKRLCYLTRSPLDASPYAELALPALAKAGWDITVVATNADRSILREVRPFACHMRNLVHQNNGGPLVREIELLRELLRARFGDYDVIYVNSQSLSARAAVALAGPKMGRRIVYHNPDYYDPISYPGYFALERRLCRKADLYINNEFHRAYITQTAYRLCCQVITLPPNLPSNWPVPSRSEERRREITANQENAFVLMLHGSYAEIRMVPELFRALSLLPARFRLVMTGADYRKGEVDAVLARLGIANRVVRLPRIGFQEMFDYTVSADAGVLLYQNNDLGNFFTAPGRMTEYLACGLPLLGTNHTGLENLMLRYRLGETVDSPDPRSVADGILRLEQAIRAGNLSRERMRSQFLERFAFEHWEPLLVRSFQDLSERKASIQSRPPFPWIRKS